MQDTGDLFCLPFHHHALAICPYTKVVFPSSKLVGLCGNIRCLQDTNEPDVPSDFSSELDIVARRGMARIFMSIL